MKKNILFGICILMAAALLIGVVWYSRIAEEPVENAGYADNAPVEQTSLYYGDEEYILKDNIETYLLIGTDNAEAYQEQDDTAAYYNFHQADFLILLALDLDANTADMIQLNRDTMTNVPWLDVLGKVGGSEFKQICRAYNYGDGGAASCKNTRNAVSNLLFYAPIDYYIQIPMSAIGVLNDLVGGVPVTIPEDLSTVDPAFVQGAEIRLSGEQAEKFVRARMSLADDTNLARMARQRIYMDSFQSCAKAALNSDSHFAMKIVETLAEYMQSDMTAQKLSNLIQQLDNAQIGPIQTPQGELKLGEEYYEFYVDEASLWELVRKAYCQ